MAIKEIDKIKPNFAAVSGVTSLSTRPNQPSAYGVGGLSASQLKAYFDKFPQEVADKYNALCDILADPNNSLKHIAWEDGKSLAEFFSTITNGVLAKKLSAQDPTDTDNESYKPLQDILDDMYSIVATVVAYLGNPKSGKKLENEYVQKDANGNVTVDGTITANGEITAKKDITVRNAQISAPRIVATSSANLKMFTTDKLTVEKSENGKLGDATIAGNLEVGGTATIGGESVVTKDSNGAVYVNSITARNGAALDGYILIGDGANENTRIEAYCSASFGDTDVVGLTVNDSASIGGDLTVGGELFVTGKTTTVEHETLTVKDNLIVVNSDGTSTGKSGLVINTGESIDSNQYVAYGILYGSQGDAVYIGKGVLEYAEDGYDMSATFTFNENQAVPLAARSGTWYNKSIPMWDSSKHAFVSSGLNVYELRGISEYNYEITDPSSFTTENLAQMRGNILISCDINTDEDSVTVTVPSKITAINFNDHETNYTIIGHHNCRLIGAKMGVNSAYDNTISNFGSIEFCKWSGQYVNCNRIAHSEVWHAINCRFITDCAPSYFETHDANFDGCSNITNIRIFDLEEDYGVEFINCDHISNVSTDGSGDGKILYTNCTHVDALTCAGYGVGVPCIDASGIVSFLESAEGGSYGT